MVNVLLGGRVIFCCRFGEELFSDPLWFLNCFLLGCFIFLNPSACKWKAPNFHPLTSIYKSTDPQFSSQSAPMIDQRNWTSSFSTMEACKWSERLGAWLMLMCLRSSCSIARNNSNVLWLIRVSPPRLIEAIQSCDSLDSSSPSSSKSNKQSWRSSFRGCADFVRFFFSMLLVYTLISFYVRAECAVAVASEDSSGQCNFINSLNTWSPMYWQN